MKKLYFICAIFTFALSIVYLFMKDISNACVAGVATLAILNSYSILKIKK